jgi:hypothetical protein
MGGRVVFLKFPSLILHVNWVPRQNCGSVRLGTQVSCSHRVVGQTARAASGWTGLESRLQESHRFMVTVSASASSN